MNTLLTLARTIELDPDEKADMPLLRLADHAIGLWKAARDVGDPVLLEALRPLVTHIARALARDLMSGREDSTSH